MKELYLAGSCVVLQEVFQNMKGVEAVTAGRAQADNDVEIKGIQIVYNPKKMDICGILKAYYEAVDPFAIADDPLEQPAVVYSSSEDIPQIEYYARFMQNRGAEPAAALGNLIVNDSITPGRELRRMQVRYGRLIEFVPQAD